MLFPLFDHNPHRRFPWVTLLLIVANVWIMWQASQLSERDYTEVIVRRGFIPLRLTQIDNPRPLLIRQALTPVDGQLQQPPVEVRLVNDSLAVYGTLLSTQFLHGGWLHLVLNMWMLWVFGNNMEDRLGHLVFAGFYLAGGVVATLCHWAVAPDSLLPVIGASGAVAAVLGGYALSFPWVKIRTLLFLGFPLLLDLPAFIVLSAWMILETVAGVLGLRLGAGVGAGVAHWAHIGGFVAGLILMPLLAIGIPPADEDWKTESDALFRFGEETDPKPPSRE